MFKFFYIFLFLISFPIFANETINKIIDLSEAESTYTLRIDKLKKNSMFKLSPIGDEGSTFHTASIRINKEMENLTQFYLSWQQMKLLMVDAYLKTYTEKELNYLLTMYSSEMGRNILSKEILFDENTNKIIGQHMENFQKEQMVLSKEYREISDQHTKELISNLPKE